MKNLCNTIFFLRLRNILLTKIVLLLSVQYPVTCHTISVTNYHFTWYSLVINVVFNIVSVV
jgi:hypothetical protein